MSRREDFPFKGKRYLLNIATNEVHDLEMEEVECQIDRIPMYQVLMFDTLEAALNHQRISTGRSNGCIWCLPRQHNS